MKQTRFGLLAIAAAIGAAAFTATPGNARSEAQLVNYKWLDLSTNTFVGGGAQMSQEEAQSLYFPTCNGSDVNCAQAYSGNTPQPIFIQRASR